MAALPKVDKIWMDGQLVDWDAANVHVLTHALHYGSGVFEGIRCYETPKGPAVFRLTEHMERLERSAKMLRMEPTHSVEEMVEATLELIRVNGLKECYIRPVVMRGYGVMGLDPLPAPVQTFIAVWPWGSYLGEEALAQGVDAGVSSWRQRGNNDHGYAEAILLNEAGMVCEGTGENIFVVRDEQIVTPPVSDGLLEGLTRDTVIQLAVDMDFEIMEASLVRTDLYQADEIFFTGTAAEVVPIKSVDRRPIGEPGPITKAIQDAYFRVVRGGEPEYEYWLETV